VIFWNSPVSDLIYLLSSLRAPDEFSVVWRTRELTW